MKTNLFGSVTVNSETNPLLSKNVNSLAFKVSIFRDEVIKVSRLINIPDNTTLQSLVTLKAQPRACLSQPPFWRRFSLVAIVKK